MILNFIALPSINLFTDFFICLYGSNFIFQFTPYAVVVHRDEGSVNEN